MCIELEMWIDYFAQTAEITTFLSITKSYNSSALPTAQEQSSNSWVWPGHCLLFQGNPVQQQPACAILFQTFPTSVHSVYSTRSHSSHPNFVGKKIHPLGKLKCWSPLRSFISCSSNWPFLVPYDSIQTSLQYLSPRQCSLIFVTPGLNTKNGTQ